MDDSVFCTPTNYGDELTVIDMASTKSILLDTSKLNRNILPRKNLYKQYKRQTQVVPKWTELELKLLTEFIMLYTDGRRWPLHKNMAFWNNAGEYMQQFLHTSYVRSGKDHFIS